MWLVFLIIWACIVVLVYAHLVFDYMYHYTNMRQKFHKLKEIFTEE